MNVTAAASTYLTVWAAGKTRPTASNLNPARGQTVANSVFTGVDATNRFDIYNQAGTTDLIADLAGAFQQYVYPAGTPVSISVTRGTYVRHIIS